MIPWALDCQLGLSLVLVNMGPISEIWAEEARIMGFGPVICPKRTNEEIEAQVSNINDHISGNKTVEKYGESYEG